MAAKSTHRLVTAPYHIFDCNGVRVGVFGLVTKAVAGYKEAADLEIADPVETARKMVAQLQGQADVIVALTHLGYPVDLDLAKSVPGINVIIGGHSHTWIFEPTPVEVGGPGADKRVCIVCQDGEYGKCVGKLDLTLVPAEGHRYRVATYAGRLVDVEHSIQPARDIENILEHYSAASAKHTAGSEH